MAHVSRMGHDTLDDDEVRKAVEEQDSGISMDGSSRRDFDVNKKRRQSRLFDDSGKWFSQEARRFSTRATNLIVQVPALQLRRIAQTSGVHSIRSETQHFVGIATLHGPLRIYRSRGKYRLFWVIAMIFCCFMMLYQTYKLIELYLDKPIVSQVSFLQPDEGLSFPLVTLCRFNFINRPFLADFMKRENVSQAFILFVLQSVVDISTLSNFVDEANLTNAHEEYTRYMKRNPKFSVNDFFRQSSPTCSETLSICNIGAEEFSCCEYAKVRMTDMGNCYTIDLDSHPSSIIKRIGASNGLQIYANIPKDEQEDVLDVPSYLTDSKVGFRYFVHSRNDYPFITSEGIGVQLGHRTFSAISPHRFILMNQNEGGRCIDQWPEETSSKNLSVISDTLGEYTSSKCVAICLGLYFFEKCGCTPLVYNYNGTFPTCTVYENYHECLKKALNVSVNSTTDQIMRRINPPCLSNCKMECQRWDYQIFNSYSQPFSRTATAYMLKHEKLRQAKLDESFIGIDIYYRDIAYTEYKQVHKTSLSEVWSSLGGNMGLFLGMSILSVIEVIIYLCKISWLFLSRKRREHMIAKDEQQKQRKTGISGIIEAANSVAMSPNPRFSSSSSSSTSSIMPTPTNMSTRFKKFTDSLKNSTKVWPKQSFEDTRNIQTSNTRMGRTTTNTQQEDFVELELEVGMSQASTPNGTRRTAPAQIKRSRTLSISMEDQKILAAELEKRRPTYISLELNGVDLKPKPNIIRRSFDMLATNAIKPRKSSATKNMALNEITLDAGKLKPPNLTVPSNLTVPPYPADDYFVPSLNSTQASTKLMKFHQMMGDTDRRNSWAPAVERTIENFVNEEALKNVEDSKTVDEEVLNTLDDSTNWDFKTDNDAQRIDTQNDAPNIDTQNDAQSMGTEIPTQWQPITRIEILKDQSTRVYIDDPDMKYPDLTETKSPHSIVDLSSLDR